MAVMFHRRLAIPLWVIAFFAVALTAPPPATQFLMPPATLLAIAVFGIAVIVFTMPCVLPWLRTSRSVVRVLPSRDRDKTSAAITMAAGTCVRTLDELNVSTADDALDLVRMDDDGGWQMARPLAQRRPAHGLIRPSHDTPSSSVSPPTADKDEPGEPMTWRRRHDTTSRMTRSGVPH